MDVLSDVVEAEPLPPAISVDVLKVDSVALIGLITSDNSWRQESAKLLYVPESDVLNIDQWLSLASSKWVEHASWTSSIWLLLLLRSDVDRPPDWMVDCHVFVEDVRDATSRAWKHRFSRAWVSLDVDSLERVIEEHI